MHTHYHYFHLPHHKHRFLSSFYIAAILRTFVFLFLALFLPILILKHYLFMGERYALMIMITYFIYHTINQVFYIPLAGKLGARWGLRVNFLISQICLILFLFFIRSGNYLAGFFVFGPASMFWWYSYHLYFTDFGEKDRYGKQIGLIEAVSFLSGAVAPLIGGYVLEAGGSLALYSFSIGIVFVSLFFIFRLKEPAVINTARFSTVLKNIKNNRDDFIAFIGAGAEESIATIIWPVLLFFVFKDYLKVGSYFSFIMITVVIVNYIVGVMVDRTKKERLEKIGSLAIFISWIGRALLRHPLALGLFEIVHKLFQSFFRLPMLVIAYNHADPGKEEYFTFREFSYKVGALLGYVPFLVLVYFNLPIWSILIFSAFYSLFPLRMKT